MPMRAHHFGHDHRVVSKAGLDALLRPQDSILALIDHQAFQFSNMNSHEPMIMNNVVGLEPLIRDQLDVAARSSKRRVT